MAFETLALVGIELKLVAELHEVYGMRAPGTAPERMLAYVVAWAHRRGVGLVPGGLALAVGSPLRRQLERRLIARAGRSAVSLGPLLTGAAAGRCSTGGRPAGSAPRSVMTCGVGRRRGRPGRIDRSGAPGSRLATIPASVPGARPSR